MSVVTVVIPTYDRSALLARTLRSVLAQRGVGLQVVVVADGFTDETADMIGRLADPRVILLRNPVPVGVSTARNQGIEAATGDWVAFLDDDDLWAPDKLASQLRAAEREARGWAYGGSVTVTGALEILAGGPPPAADAVVGQLPWRNSVPAGASNVIVRADVLAAAGPFDPRLRHTADWDLWIRLGRLGPPAVVGEPVLAYCLHGSNMSAARGTLQAELELIERRYGELRGGAPVDRAHVYRWAAWNYLWAGRRSEAFRAYARAVLAGDPASLGRAAVALLDRDAARRGLRRHRPDPAWAARAMVWLRQLPTA